MDYPICTSILAMGVTFSTKSSLLIEEYTRDLAIGCLLGSVRDV